MDAGALLRELRGRVDRAENTHMGTHGVAKTGKSIGAAAKKSRRHLEGMKASKAQTPVARGECLTLPVDDDLTFIEAADLPELMKTATVVDASRTNGHLLDSVHVPPHAWDFLTPAARKLCETGRRLIFLDIRSARAARREYPNLDVAVVRGGFDACLEALPSVPAAGGLASILPSLAAAPPCQNALQVTVDLCYTQGRRVVRLAGAWGIP
mgnify:CR=1 FL=1